MAGKSQTPSQTALRTRSASLPERQTRPEDSPYYSQIKEKEQQDARRADPNYAKGGPKSRADYSSAPSGGNSAASIIQNEIDRALQQKTNAETQRAFNEQRQGERETTTRNRVGLPGPEQVHYTTAISPERVRHEGIQADDQSGATSLPSAPRIISPYDQYKARSAYEQQRAGERGDVNPPQRLDMGDFAGETPREPSIWAQAGQALSGASAGAADLLNRAGAGIDKALFPPDTNPFSPNKLLPGGVWGGMAAAGAMGGTMPPIGVQNPIDNEGYKNLVEAASGKPYPEYNPNIGYAMPTYNPINPNLPAEFGSGVPHVPPVIAQRFQNNLNAVLSGGQAGVAPGTELTAWERIAAPAKNWALQEAATVKNAAMPEGERIGWGEGNKDQVTKSVLSGVVAAAPLATSKMRWATAVIVGGQTLAEVAQIVAENSLKGMGQFAVEHPDQAPFVKAAMTIPGLTYGVATGIKAGLAGAQALDEVAWYAPVPALGGASVMDAVVTLPDYALQKAGLANHNVKLDDNNFPLFVTSDVVGGMLDEQMTRALQQNDAEEVKKIQEFARLEPWVMIGDQESRENYIRSYLEADDTADKAKQDAARMQQEIFDVRATNFVLNPEEQKRQQMKAYEAARLGAIADYYDQIDPVALVDSYMMGNPLQVGAQLLPYSSLTFDALLPAGVHVYGSVKDVRMNRAAKEYGVGSVSNIPISAAQVVVEDLPGMTPEAATRVRDNFAAAVSLAPTPSDPVPFDGNVYEPVPAPSIQGDLAPGTFVIWRVSEDLPDTYGVVGRKVETADGGKFYTVDEVMPRPDGVSVRRGQTAIPESQLVAFKQKAGQPAPVAAPGAAAAVDVQIGPDGLPVVGNAAQPAPPAEGAVPATVSGKLMGLDDYVKSTATLYDETAQGGNLKWEGSHERSGVEAAKKDTAKAKILGLGGNLYRSDKTASIARAWRAIPVIGAMLDGVTRVEDAQVILKAFVSDPVSLYRGIKADWQSPALIKRAELNGGVVRFPILGALNKPTQDAMETFRGVVNDMVTNGDALREAGRLVIPAVLTEAFNGIVYRAGLDWDAYQKIYTQLPFGTESVRAKNGAPNTIEYVSADGRVLDTHVFANADQAKRAVGEMGHVRDYDQRFHMNLVDVVGKKLRRFFSIPFIGMNPANVIANVSNAVFNGFTDGVPVWSVSEPFRWRNTDRIRGQMEKWFGAPDPSLRAVGTGTAFTGATEAMTGVSAPDDHGSVTPWGPGWESNRDRWLRPFSKILVRNEERMGIRMKYAGIQDFLSKYGRAATDERFIPDLVNMGLDLNTATHVAEAFYSTLMIDGPAKAMDAAIKELSDVSHQKSVMDYDKKWSEILTPDAASEYNVIVRTSRTPQEMRMRLAVLYARVKQEYQQQIATAGPEAGRHTNETSNLLYELSGLKRYEKNGGPDAAGKINATASLQRQFLAAREGFFAIFKAQPDTRAARVIYDTWQKIEHMRADAQMRIDTEMEKLAAEKNQAPAFLDLKTQVWSDFYARSMQLLGDQSKRWQSGDPFNDIVVDWENVAKNAFDNEQLLMNDWERMDPGKAVDSNGQVSPDFIAARSQLRKVESTAIARFFAGVFAGKAPINRSMDEFISVQRDMLVRYQQLAQVLDAAYGDAKSNKISWPEYYKVRNQQWRSYGDYVWERYNVGMLNAVRDRVARAVPEPLRDKALAKWMAQWEGSVAAFSIGEDVAGRIRASVRNKMKVAGFDKQGNKLSIQQVDTQIMRLLNAELRAMGMNTLPLKLENVPVSTLNQLDNRILPVLDMIADIYVANRGVREAELSARNVQSAASAKTAAEKKQADLQAAAAASLQREAAAIPAGTPAEAAVSSPSVAEAVPAGETGGAAPPVSPEPTYPIEPGAPGAYLTDMPDGTPVHIGDTVTWESSSAQYRGVVTGLLPSGKLAVERIEPGLQPGQRGPVSKRPLTGVQKVLTFAGEDVTPAAVVDEVAPESVVASTEEPATAVGQISPESAAPQVAADAEPAIQPAEPARLIPEPATPQGPVRASGEPAMRTKTQQFRDMGGKRLSIGDPLFAVTSKSRLNIVGAPANAASADGVVTGVTAMPRGGNMLEVRWTFYDKDGKAIGNPLDRTHDNQDVVTAMELRKGRAGPETVSPAKPVAAAMGSLSNPQVGDVIVRTVQVPGRPGPPRTIRMVITAVGEDGSVTARLEKGPRVTTTISADIVKAGQGTDAGGSYQLAYEPKAEPAQPALAAAPAPEVAARPVEAAAPAVQEAPAERANGIQIDSVTAPRGLVGKRVLGTSDGGREYLLEYEVVEAKDLIASHGPDGKSNPAYPQEYQSCDRGNEANMLNVSRIAGRFDPSRALEDAKALADGTIVVGADNVVESGNGRTMAFGNLSPEQYANYRDRLIAASTAYGINPEEVAKMERPILVRRRLSGERAAFVNDANTRTSGEFNPAETAQAIANQVTAQDLNLIQESLLAQTDETKTESARALLLKESSVPLVRRLISLLGPNEQGRYAGTPGQASKAALELVVDVLKAIVIKDKNLRDDVLLSTSGELGRVGQALEKSIARLALLEKSNEQMALGGTLTAALNKVREIRNDPELRKNWRNQIPAAFNAEEQIVNDLVAFIMDNLAKPNNITALLNQYAIDAMKEPGTGGQQGLFGGRTREELLTETIAASREGKLAEAGIPMPFSEAQDVNTGIFVDRMMDKGSPVKGGRTFTVNYRMADDSMQTYRITMTQRLKSVRKGSHPEEFQWILKSAEKIADDGTATALQLDKAGIPEGHGNSQRAAEMALESVVEPLVGTRGKMNAEPVSLAKPAAAPAAEAAAPVEAAAPEPAAPVAPPPPPAPPPTPAGPTPERMAELKAHYDALVQKLREAMVANTNNGTSRKPTLGEAALYQLERLQQLMGNTLHDGDAIVYGTGPDPARAQIPQAVKMRAAQYVTGSMNNAWNQILTGANRFGDSMRSFGMVDFWNNTRADELLGLFVPFSFWKTRTIKNSLERMVREPRWFGYAVRLERALEQQSRTQPYQISQDEEQRILSPFEQTQQYPKRFEFNVGLGGLNIGGSQWDMLARVMPSNYWPMAHVMLDNRYSDNETSDPMSMFVDSMSRSGLNTYPFWGEVAQAVTTDAEGGDFFKARWHPLDWTAQSRLLLTYGVMRKVPPELWGQWIGPSSVTSTPFAAYYVGRTLTNMLQEGRISDSMAGAAMAYLDHAANGRPLPPEWESLNKQAVYDVLKQAQDIAFKVASVQQATSLISGIPLNAFNKAELETMRSQREQGSLYYDTEQKQDTQMNPYGSNLAVEAYRGFNPMADQRSLQSGILNQPQPGKSIGEKWAKSAMYDAVEPRIQEMQAAMSQYGTAFAQKGADKNDIYAARKEAAVNYAKQVLGEDAVAAWVEANGGSDNVRDNVSEGEVVAFVRDSLQAQFPSYVPWEQRPENNPALAGGPMPTAQPWQVSPFQQPSMVPPGQFPPGAPMQAGLGEAPSTQPVAPTAPPTMQAGAIQNVPSDMNPAEARYNAMQQAVQDVFYMQGRPDYASFVNETSKNYDAYYAAQDRFRAQQVQELARRTGISPQEANQMLDAYQGRNLSPTEQGRFAQIDQQSAVDDEHWAAYNAFGDDTAGRAQYLMDNPDFAEGAYRDYKLGKKGQTGPDGKIDDGNWEWYKSYVEGGGGGRFPPGAWKKMTAEQQQEAMTRFGSDINELNRQYGALPKGSQERKDFLKAHPQLIELWKYETEIGVLEARADTRDYQPRQRSASYSNIYSGPRRGGGGSWSGAQAMLQGGGAVGGAGVGPQVQGMPFVSNYADRPFQSNRRAPTPWELRTNDLLIRPEDLARSEQQLSPMNPQLWNIYTRLMMNTRR